MITEFHWAFAAGFLAFALTTAVRSMNAKPAIQIVTMDFAEAMSMPIPLMIPDSQIGDPVRAPEMVGDVMNTAAALQIINEREGR